MNDYRARFGPHNPDETYVAHAIAEQLVDLGEVQMNYATVGDAVVAGAAPHPGPDRVVVGLRGGDAAARRALPGVRRRSPGPGPQHAHAWPLHARQHRQRPGPLPRPRDRATGDRERPVLGRRPRRLAVGVRQARSGARGALRGPAAVRVGGPAGHRSRHPPVHRADVRPLEHLPGRPVVDRGLGRDARRIRGSTAGAPEVHPGARRAAAEPEGVRPRVGPVVLDRDGRRRRATTSGCCAASRFPRCC